MQILVSIGTVEASPQIGEMLPLWWDFFGYNKNWYHKNGPEFIKLMFAVLYELWTMGLTRCYKTEGFLHLYYKTPNSAIRGTWGTCK